MLNGAVLGWAGILLGLGGAPTIADSCWYFDLGNLLESANRNIEDGVIVVGQISGRPYQVIIPGDDLTTLEQVQQCIPDAFITRSRFGAYIQAGAFDNRGDAETVRAFLRSRQYDARVIYFP